MKTLLSSLLLFLFIHIAAAQSSFVRIYDYGDGAELYGIDQTDDGGFILHGRIHNDTSSFYGNYMELLVKTDGAGNVEWDTVYYDVVHSADGWDIHQTSDGGYLTVCSENIADLGGPPVAPWATVRKMNSSGDILWSIDFPEEYIHIQFTEDDGFVTNYKYHNNITDKYELKIIKVNASGSILWTKTYTDGMGERYFGKIQTDGDGYVITGFSGETTHDTTFVMKFDAYGDTIQVKTLHDFSSQSCSVTSDGSILVYGFLVDSVLEGGRFYKFNSGLAEIWNSSAPFGIEFLLFGAFETSPGNYVYGGTNFDEDTIAITSLYELSPDGDSLWMHYFSDSYSLHPFAGIKTNDDRFAFTGEYYNYAGTLDKEFLMVTDRSGNVAKAKITGSVFYDIDGNLTRDVTDIGIPDLLITAAPGPFYGATDSHGNYCMYVYDTATYQISAPDPVYYYQTYPTDPFYQSVEIPVLTSFTDSIVTVSNIDFAKNADPVQDLFADITGLPVPSGFAGQLVATIGNTGSVTIDSDIFSVKLDPKYVLDSTDIPYDSYSDHVITWNYTHFTPFETRAYKIFVTPLPGVLPETDSLLNIASISPVYTDITPENNIDTLLLSEEHPWDPNHKTVEPAGDGEDGVIDPATTILTYIIDFQNTGNYPASFVTIIDTLDTDLAFSTLHMISSSHLYTMEFIYPNIVEWHFYDINLPDSATNFLLSQGFVKFSIDLQDGLAPGTVIENTAGIYFDYNPVVLTNTVINTLKMPDEITTQQSIPDIHVYPNPATNQLHIDGITSEATITLTDISGKEAGEYSLSRDGAVNIDFLPPGIYLLTVMNQFSSSTIKVIKI